MRDKRKERTGGRQRERESKRKRTERRKERDRFQGWRVWPFRQVETLRSPVLSVGASDLPVVGGSY